MTIDELQIQLDLNLDDKVSILDEYASECPEGYFFIDEEDGHCYLFDKHGDLDDINKIKTISEGCIKKDIKKITIPDSVMDIGDSTFEGCIMLTSVTIPDSAMSIGSGAFFGCIRLTDVTIGSGVTSIGGYAFCGCIGLTSATVPGSVTSIGDYAFYDYDCNNLKSLIFKDKTIDQVKSMDNYPFRIADESIIKCQS